MSGETGKVKKPGSTHPRPHQAEGADTPVAGRVTRESLLEWSRENTKLVRVSVFALRGEHMCVWQKHTPTPHRLGWEPPKGPGSPIPWSTTKPQAQGQGLYGFRPRAGQSTPHSQSQLFSTAAHQWPRVSSGPPGTDPPAHTDCPHSHSFPTNPPP